MKLIKLSTLIITLMPYTVITHQSAQQSKRTCQSTLQKESQEQIPNHQLKRIDMDREEFAQLIQKEKLRREIEKEEKAIAAVLATQ